MQMATKPTPLPTSSLTLKETVILVSQIKITHSCSSTFLAPYTLHRTTLHHLTLYTKAS